MSPNSSEVKFEIGHVLFIDIVGYSKLLINEQSDQIQKFIRNYRGDPRFAALCQKLKLPAPQPAEVKS